MNEREKTKTISLPAELYDRVLMRVKTTGFDSVDEYVSFVLSEVLSEEDGTAHTSDDQEEEVKKRLRGLGYLE